MDECVREHEVNDTVQVSLQAKILLVATAEAVADAVVVVEDRGDGIEAEAINLVLVQEPRQVGEEESFDLVLSVVEDH